MEGSDDTEAVQTVLNDHQLTSNSPDDATPQSSNEAAEEAPPDPSNDQLTAQIVKQVNFYFSDANLPTDAFLLKEVHKNPEGWGKPVAYFHEHFMSHSYTTSSSTCSAGQIDC